MTSSQCKGSAFGSVSLSVGEVKDFNPVEKY